MINRLSVDIFDVIIYELDIRPFHPIATITTAAGTQRYSHIRGKNVDNFK